MGIYLICILLQVYFYVCLYVCVCVYLHTHVCKCLQKPEEGFRFPGDVAVGACELHSMGAEI